MMIVGLTGGIGSGKSTVADFFKALGVPVYNSDQEAKRLMGTSKTLKKAIVELLGENAYIGQKLNKKHISSMIFNDKSLLEKMNSLVHPAVRTHFLGWTKKQNTPYVIQESALIFENSKTGHYDTTILVIAPKDLRIQRVMDRDGTSRQAVLERMENQLNDDEKIPLADFVLENIEVHKTKYLVEELHKVLLNNC